MPELGATRQLARYAATAAYEDLPPDAVAATRFVILDTLAVAIAGAPTAASTGVAAIAERSIWTPVATLIGRRLRTDVASAALVNGTTAHALDYDDVSFAASAHPSVSLLPCLLALAEEAHASGPDLLRAYAVGFQCAVALGRTMNPGHYGHGWHGTGTIGTIAATLAAGNLLQLTEDEICAAVAIAASSASGLRGNFGTDVKPYQVGNAGRSAVMAIMLARQGMVAVDNILEANQGFFEVYSPSDERPVALVADWERGWAVLDPGISTKLFPSCASSHASIGSILALRADGLRADDVADISAGLTDIAAGNMRYPHPTTALEAKFSLQYCVARALLDGGLTLDHFADAAIADAPTELMERIEVHHDVELTAAYEWGAHRPALMTVRTRSGRTLNHRADAPPGAPGTFSREMLHDKVRDCMSRGSVSGHPDELIQCVESLDQCHDINDLTRLLAAP